MRAGKVMSTPITATKMTALAGIRVRGLTFDRKLDPGIAPSRLKAKVIRDALVRQAVVQKSWPAVEINRIEEVPPLG